MHLLMHLVHALHAYVEYEAFIGTAVHRSFLSARQSVTCVLRTSSRAFGITDGVCLSIMHR